jgi:hypothetical protein
MNDSTNENNLFEFHFGSFPTYSTNHSLEADPSLFFQHHQPQNSYSFLSDTLMNMKQDHPMFSSPQLKPISTLQVQRKRFKTTTANNQYGGLLSPGLKPLDQSQSGSDAQKEEQEDDDEDESFSDDDDSNEDSAGSKRRGKYKVYSDAEKAKIINFMMKHGIQKTLEIFSDKNHKITKRKLKSWIDSQHKIKGVKGRKTTDPNRDQTLYEWVSLFQREYGRAPTRKEATKKALELSGDPTFQASKGWLDKFSRKYNIEFTPLKIIPPKNKKKADGFLEDDSGSAFSNSDSSGIDNISPLLQAMQPHQQQIQQPKELKMKQWTLETSVMQTNEQEADAPKINSFFSFGNNNKSNLMEGLNFGKKDSIIHLEPNLYQQPINEGMGFLYGYPMNYQHNFQMNYTPNLGDNYPMNLPINNQLHYEINGFFESGVSYDNNGFMHDSHMKIEHPY